MGFVRLGFGGRVPWPDVVRARATRPASLASWRGQATTSGERGQVDADDGHGRTRVAGQRGQIGEVR
nr:hypothetical protein [Kibdelosporangium sp. MJ126-NF4]CTQ95731.1 hypothetical protein [Kibdelosporangium sp. MJ126-NF4]